MTAAMTTTVQEVEQAELQARLRRAQTALLAAQAEKAEAETRLLHAQERKRMYEREARCPGCAAAVIVGVLVLGSLAVGALVGYVFPNPKPAPIVINVPAQPAQPAQ